MGDSFWSLRKAALLSDLGRDAAASELSAQVLITIREQTLRGQKDVAAWSRESFTMLFRRGFLTLEAVSGHFVEFSHPTGARSGILTIFCFWRRVLNAVRVSRPEKAVLVEAMWSVHCLFLQMACRSLRNRA